MTPEQFDDAASSTRLADHTKAAARLVLVEGARMAEAARRSGMSRQQLGEAVARVETAHLRSRGLPATWEVVTVCLPSVQAKVVRDLERQARRAAGLTVD